MRVAFYCSSLSRSAGGVYYAASGLALGLSKLGVDVTVLGGADIHMDEDRQVWEHLKLITHRTVPGGYGFDWRMLRTIVGLRPDVLHVHGIWNAGSVYGRAASLMGIPVMVSPHGMLDAWILNRKMRVKKVHATLLERPLLARGLVHALSNSEAQAVSAFMPALSTRTFIVPNGVSSTDVPPSSTGKSGFLFLGRLHPKKQVVELIEAWRSQGPGDTTLTIAGWGDPDYEARVKALCDGRKVIFVGSQYGEAKARLLARSRWFILPSLSEGLPMAALEALQQGCIPLLTPECNLPELAANGIGYEMRSDFGDFALLMQRLAGMSEGELTQSSSRCIAEARAYAWDAIAGRMLPYYASLATAPGETTRPKEGLFH